MNLRRALQEQAIQHGLHASALARLYQLAKLTPEPQQLAAAWPSACAIGGGALTGMGAIMWVAANWMGFGRYGRLLLAEMSVFLPLALLWWRPQWRLPLAVMALLGIGALLACIGQTYQTGADPWQLFAVWALLALPLCLGIRHETVWLPWLLVAMTALSLLQGTEPSGFGSAGFNELLLPQLVIFGTAIVLAVAARRPLAARLGIGKWSVGFATINAVSLLTFTAMTGLLHGRSGFLWSVLMVLAAATAMFSTRAFFDALGFCSSLLALNFLGHTAVLSFPLVSYGSADWLGSWFYITMIIGSIIAVRRFWQSATCKREGGIQ